MALLSFLHSLVCKKCKTTSGSYHEHKAHRREERRQRQVLKKHQISLPQLPVKHWRMSWEHQSRNVVVCSAELSHEPRIPSPVELDAASGTSSSSPVIPSLVIGVTYTTTVETTTISALHFSASLSSPHPTVRRIPANSNLRLLAENYSNISSMPPQLALPWESRPRPTIITEMPVVIPVDVKPLPTLPVKQCDSLLLLDSPSDSSGESLCSLSNSPTPSSTPSTPNACISLPECPTPASFRNRMAARQSLFESNSTGDNSNGRSSKGARSHRRRHSGSSIGSITATSSGPRYIPSSKPQPRSRSVVPSPSTPQTTLPFTYKTLDEILMTSQKASSDPSSSSDSSLSSFSSSDSDASLTLSSSSSSSSPSFSSSSSPSFPSPSVEPHTSESRPLPPPKEQYDAPVASTSSSSDSSTTLSRSFIKNRPSRRYQPSAALARILSNNYKPFRNSPSSGPRLLIPYNSSRGYAMLKAMRRLLVIPAEWSAAQTLLFVLQHPNLRRLSLPSSQPSSSSKSSVLSSSSTYRDLLSVPRCNSIDWKGALQSINAPTRYQAMNPVPQTPTRARKPVSAAASLASYPYLAPSSASPLATFTPFSASDRELVSSWLESGEPLFTLQTSLSSLLLRKSLRARSRRQFTGTWRASRAAQMEALTKSLAVRFCNNNMIVSTISDTKRYDIALNPRCRYHQLWTGAGASPLSSSVDLVNT
ncbi:hypothetical protein SBRCBS47491_009397 [Sporothrix bragantina]|uniref:Uncharacterized protein n=1 Tax=Sporothrix bragantina TaxID=671064 RepID=A0ABP0CUD1_9PEZI